MPPEDGRIDTAPEAAHPTMIEPNTDSTSDEVYVIGPSDSSPAIGSEPRASVPIISNGAPIMEFSSAYIF